MSMRVTRRRFSGLALGGIAAVPVISHVQAGQDWQAHIQDALEVMSTPDRTLRLAAFERGNDQTPKMSAVVELTWAPGTRSRRFVAAGETEADAAEGLLARVRETFSIPTV